MKSSRTTNRTLLGAAAAAMTLSLAACGTTHAKHHSSIVKTAPSPHPVTASNRTIWLLAYSHFNQVVSNSKVLQLFERGTVYEPITSRQTANTLHNIIPTADFHSAALLAQKIASPPFLRSVGAIIYDNERYANTPQIEQLNPLHYYTEVSHLAKDHHLTSICDFIQPDRLPASERNPSNEVPNCSIIGLNTVQQSERNPQTYLAVVSRAVRTIRSVEPSVPIIAGISANPRGAPVTAAELTTDMRIVAPLVNGFWLNVPAPGVGCPSCHEPDPNLLQQALANLPASFTTG
ncbi:hypothetical protein [Ferrimicrobium acidiphilum]|uniref:Uncharacterized protein n=1 Tax=Ferrimicrobium acidiphilum TaxID=121039 RepID=A0ABV3Y5N2_9ACTN